MQPSTYTVAVDIGGTFTDVVAIEGGSGRMAMGKVLTTPADLQRGVLDGLADAARELGVELSGLLGRAERMVHATTQSSNAVFAFAGARTAVLTTRGFGDTLIVMRATGRVAGLSVFERHHYRATDKPRLLADERDIFEISERVDCNGRVVVPLDEAAVRAAAREIRRKGYAAVAVAYLFSHKNAAHERRTAEILAEEAPELYVSTSAAVAPVIGEYERSATALFNAYVGPVIDGYLRRLAHNPRGSRPAPAAPHRAVERRGDDDCAARADLHRRVRAGRRRRRRGASRALARPARRHCDRCRRDHFQGGADPRRGMGLQPRDGAQPVPAAPADDRRRFDRRRRRFDRLGRRRAPARGPAQRRRGAGPGVLRAGRHRADRDRRGSPARLSLAGAFPRRTHGAAHRCGARGGPEPHRRHRSSTATCSPRPPAFARSSTARWPT